MITISKMIRLFESIQLAVQNPSQPEHLTGLRLFPERASSIAAQVDYLFLFLVIVCGLTGLGIAFTLIFFAVRYHHTREVDRTQRVVSTMKLEVIWSVIPLGIFMIIFFWGAWLYFRIQQAPRGSALPIYVVAQQWMWVFQHPDGQREINDLHVPLGRDVKLMMTSEDVIHSFYVPEFRVKQDVLPDRYTNIWFRPIKTGTFHLFCAEYCGTSHSAMRGRVIVMLPEDYDAWLRGRLPVQSLAERGQRLFTQLGCSSCHVANSGVRGPTLQGLFGRKVRFTDGRMRTADEQYIRDSILLPQKDVVAGYTLLMPTFQGIVNEQELLQLVEYIKSLREDQGRAAQ